MGTRETQWNAYMKRQSVHAPSPDQPLADIRRITAPNQWRGFRDWFKKIGAYCMWSFSASVKVVRGCSMLTSQLSNLKAEPKTPQQMLDLVLDNLAIENPGMFSVKVFSRYVVPKTAKIALNPKRCKIPNCTECAEWEKKAKWWLPSCCRGKNECPDLDREKRDTKKINAEVERLVYTVCDALHPALLRQLLVSWDGIKDPRTWARVPKVLDDAFADLMQTLPPESTLTCEWMPVESDEKKVEVEFDPGNPGMRYVFSKVVTSEKETVVGHVTEVTPEGQADREKVKKGWKMESITPDEF